MNRTRNIFFFVLLFCANTFCAHAEKYLTMEEAQKLCFPTATSFEEKTIRFTPEDAKAIEKKCGTKVRNLGNRISIAKADGKTIGVLLLDHVIGKHLIIDYALAVTPDGSVQQVEILEYRESHGGQIRGAKWRDQFKGKNSSSPLALNRDIYNISGATLSSRNVTEGIKRLLATYDLVVAPQLAAPGKLPGRSAKQR